MKCVQCYELFRGMALKNSAFYSSVSFNFFTNFVDSLEHIGHVVKMSVYGYRNHWFEPWLHQYVVSLSKAFNPHCFSRLSY